VVFIRRDECEDAGSPQQFHGALIKIDVKICSPIIAIVKVLEQEFEFFNFLLADVRRICDDDIESAFLVKHFREVNLEVESFLAVGQLMDEVVNFAF